MINDLVSIVTPVYNAERFVSATIESILAQTYHNWELILVNDCSRDGSEEIIRTFCQRESRIRYIKLEENSGAAISRNVGMEMTNGRYIAFLDSDDLWKPDKIYTQLDFMKKNMLGFTFTSYELISEDGVKLKKIIKAPKEMTYKKLLKNSIIGCSTVVIDKNIIGDFKMPQTRLIEDTPTWLSILSSGHKAYGLNNVLTEYRIVYGSVSNDKFKDLTKKWRMYHETLGFGFFKSLFYFTCNVFNAVKKRI